jgi:glycosyltransferase involved in cell wall biosynthesis
LNVLIVNSVVPFSPGGAEELANNLCERLNATDLARAEILRIPFCGEPFEQFAEQVFLSSTLQLPNVDRLIALSFPAYLIAHPVKTIWLVQEGRRGGDSGDGVESKGSRTSGEDRLLEIIRLAKREAFSKCHRVFANSGVTRERLIRCAGVEAEVLLPPLNNPELFANRGDDGYLFAGGRINLSNRQHLLVEALARTESCPRLIVAGQPDTPEDANRLRDAVRRFRLENRVVLDFEFQSVRRIADYVNHARACAYLPVDEDLRDQGAKQALAASKPVITARDSGAMLQLVLNGETGCVTEPDADDMAKAIDFLLGAPGRSREMGDAARRLWDSLKANWPNTIERLLS